MSKTCVSVYPYQNNYIIENEEGKQFEVQFKHRRLLENWITIEKKIFNKEYKIIK